MIRCVGLRKAFGAKPVLDGLDLDVPPGVVCAVLGPSGCGKTTLLRCIAGLERPDDGAIEIADAVVTGSPIRNPQSVIRNRFVPPERRGVGMVFQDLALWPHLTAAETVALALSGAGLPRAERLARARAALDAAGLREGRDRRPAALSGGEQQRLALARALAGGPRALLLDEPFSGLHPEVREELAGLVVRWVREAPASAPRAAVLVTHLADEALTWADRVAVCDGGRCAQAGPPADLLARPAGPAVARLLGFTTFLPAVRCADNGWVETPFGRIDCPEAAALGRCTLAFRPGDAVVRPDGGASGTAVETGIRAGGPACRVRPLPGDGSTHASLWIACPEPVGEGQPVRFDFVRRPGVITESQQGSSLK